MCEQKVHIDTVKIRIMPKRTETIKTRVTKKEKKEIENYLEESGEFESKSRLVRVLLYRHINGNSQQDIQIDTDEIKSAVDDGMDELKIGLNKIEEKIADIEQAVKTSDEISRLANDIYNEMLVLDDSIDKEFETIQDFEKIGSTPEEEAALTGSAKAFSDLFGEEEYTIRRALARANDMFPDVKFVTERDGMRRYYRDER